MKAFYFTDDSHALRYGDGRPVSVGTTHTIEGKPDLCVNGLHASVNLLDAVKYAPGHHLYLVELGGEMDKGEDKVCAQSRTYLKYYNAEGMLWEFARKQALINIEKIEPYCKEGDYQLITTYLTTGDKSIRSAAWSAAESAAESAAWSAARSARSAWSAWSAAWSAAESAAGSAESAAWAAAESAARSAESAAWSAWSAAWSAAESAASNTLTNMLIERAGWEL